MRSILLIQWELCETTSPKFKFMGGAAVRTLVGVRAWFGGAAHIAWPIRRPQMLRLIVAMSGTPLSLFLAGLALVIFVSPWPLQAAKAARVDSSDGAHNDRNLAPGQVIQRKLAGGQSHSYRVHLLSGQFLHVVADQRGIDIVLKLFGPDNAQLSRMDRWSYMRGPESLSFIAAVPGTYRLEVQAHYTNGQPGFYQLRISEIRPPSPQDAVVVAAEKAYNKGDELSLEGTPEALHDGVTELQNALRLWEQAGDKSFEATTLLYLGVDFYSSGDPQKALEYYMKALSIWPVVVDLSGEAVTLDYIGSVYESFGESEVALDYFCKGLPLARKLGERKLEAQLLHDLGMAYYSLGETQKALSYQNEASRVSETTGDRVWTAHILHHIGEIYVSMGVTTKALDYLNAALKGSHAVGDDLGEAAALDHLGSEYLSLGDNSKALKYYVRALGLRRKAGYRLGEAQTLLNIGQGYESTGENKQALSQYDQALQLSKALNARPEEASALYKLARVELRLGRFRDSLSRIEQALEIIESQRSQIHSSELRTSYFARLREPYDFYIDLLMQMHRQDPTQGYDAKALEASEGARARTLLGMLAESHASVRQGIDSDLVDREHSLQRLIDGKRDAQVSLLSAKHTEGQAAALEKELGELLAEYWELEGKIRASSPKYASLTQPRPLTVKEVQERVLDADTVLLEYALGEQRSYVWAVTRDSLVSFELPSQREIEATARQVYGFLTARNRAMKGETPEARKMRLAQAQAEYPEAAARLSRTVLGPVAPLLARKRVVIVADGALQYVPFGALPMPGPKPNTGPGDGLAGANDLDPLIVEHEVVTLPSASVLAEIRQETLGRKKAPKQVAVLADPVFDLEDNRVKGVAQQIRRPGIRKPPDGEAAFDIPWAQNRLSRSAAQVGATGGGSRFARLLFTRREADAIMEVTPAGEGLEALDFDASRTMATSPELSQYRIVHFATHGLLDSQHPELSGLVFSLIDQKGKPQNGFVTLQDIYNLDLPSDLVVLSACETALGKEIKGEGLVGLTRGFMYAGAPRVVASVWKVDDVATAELMGQFYRAMLQNGLRPAAALRQAQNWMWGQNRWSDPYYWAGFIIQGEWK